MFLKIFLGLFAILSVLGSLVAVIDPYGIWGHRIAFTPTEIIENGRRQYHAARVTISDYKTIFLGSSRVRHGLDPAVLEEEGPAYNAALGGASSTELAGFLRVIAENNRPETVLVGIDLFGFAPGRPIKGDYVSSQLAGKALLEVQIQNSLTPEAFRAAWNNVLKNLSERQPDPPVFFSDRVRGDHYKRWYSTARHCSRNCWPGFTAQTPELEKERLRALREAIDALAARDTRVVLFFNPVHVTLLDLMQQLGFAGHLELLRRELFVMTRDINGKYGRTQQGNRVELWDFSGCGAPWNEAIPDEPEAKMQYYYEMAHYTPTLGNHILQRIFETEDLGIETIPGFGIDLTDFTSAEALPRLRLEDCRGPHSAEIAELVARQKGR